MSESSRSDEVLKALVDQVLARPRRLANPETTTLAHAVRDLLAKQDAAFAVNQELATKDETIAALVAERNEAQAFAASRAATIEIDRGVIHKLEARVGQLERARDEVIELLTQAEARLNGAPQP